MPMDMPNGVDLQALIDEQKFGPFNLKVLALLFLATFVDGYDLQVPGFAAPALMKALNLTRADLPTMLSAGLFGILFGAPLLGWAGDRWGRKRAIVLGCFVCGLFSFACAFAHSIQQLAALRFFVGLGIGGVIPNAIALSAELAPRRIRAMLTTLMFIGITVGGTAPGLISAWLVPSHGWPVLFLVGGVAPMAVALLLLATLPESLLHLAAQDPAHPTVKRWAARLGIKASRFRVPRHEGGGPGFLALLAGEFAVTTPLLWLLFAITLFTMYLLTSWLPTVLEGAGAAPGQAAGLNSLFQLGGALGGLATSLLLDRLGLRLVLGLIVLAGASLFTASALGIASPSLPVVMAVSGFGVIGIQFGLNTTAGLVYPTAIRAKGIAAALSVGRLASIAGPYIGSALVPSTGAVVPGALFLAPLAPLLVGAVTVLVLMRLRPRGAAGTPAMAIGD